MLARLRTLLTDLYAREPARVNAAIVTAVVAGAGALGLALSAPAVLAIVVVLAPIIVAELTRPKVVPNTVAVDAAAGAYIEGARDAQAADAADSTQRTPPGP